MKLALIGYMTSGKSSVGKLVATLTNTKHIDLDRFIEEKEGCSISDIFKYKGELYFRKIETIYLEELLKKEGDYCISTGGGTPCYGKNMELITSHTTSVYLQTSINEIYKRLLTSKNKRPLVASLQGDDLLEFIGKHLFERNPFYQKATIIVSTDKKSTLEVAQSIIEHLQ
ncbi:MAG: shikimate kinase [Flavobacteriaceae bacterium]|nr:shikimate kinase [Flavobacteriaceae bacterium]